MQRFGRQKKEDGTDPAANWGKDRVDPNTEDPNDEDNMPIPDVGSIPATGKTRISSIRDWSEDEDDDCQILEVYDPHPVAFSYPVPSPPADSDEVLEVAPLAVGPKGMVRKRPAAASTDAGTSGTSGPAQKKARVKTIVKRRKRPVSKG